MYKISIDTGGTFTDCICEKDGNITKLKLLSKSVLRSQILEVISEHSIKIKDNWGFTIDFFKGFLFNLNDKNAQSIEVKSFDPNTRILTLNDPIFTEKTYLERSFELFTEEEVPVFAVRLLTQTPINQSFPSLELKLGSTKATNALLEGKGARVLFIVTKGFKDLLKICNQTRPDIFALNIKKPEPLHCKVIEVNEQIDAHGRILIPINLGEVKTQIDLIKSEFDTIAICFKNSYKNAIHENLLSEYLSMDFRFISTSTKLSTQIKFVPRAETTVVNAYLSPIIDTYISGIKSKLNADFLVMTSAGNLLKNNAFFPKDSLLSGPAGGIIGAAEVAKQAGFKQIISFDMGGTSTDVARYDNDFDFKSEVSIGSATIFSTALAIETVAAGGGSICSFDGHKLSVGPESAGSDPGPACYGAGGPTTITDVNLLLGRMDASNFSIPIHWQKSIEAYSPIVKSIPNYYNINDVSVKTLESFLQIANEKMAETIRKISFAKGFEPSNYALVAFGGAGGMHACAIADLLKMTKIILPADAGLLSAFGISKAKIQKIVEKAVLKPFTIESIAELQAQMNILEAEALCQLAQLTIDSKGNFVKKRVLKLRILGQEATIDIPVSDKIDYTAAQDLYKSGFISIYGYWHEALTLEVENILVQVSEKEDINSDNLFFKNKTNSIKPIESITTKKTYLNGFWQDIPIFDRLKLGVGTIIYGPALLVDPYATTVVEPGWSLSMNETLTAILTKNIQEISPKDFTQYAVLELFTNRFMGVAEQMGVMLQRTSLSVNVKERLDYSCAILDANAKLIANAPHIPVHLGSLGVCVRLVLAKIPINKGDVVITNHPKYGGSHLPDVTIISSVFTEKNQLVGYVVSRCHHAEIGGIRPASMPPNATNLEQEGVVIEPIYLVKNGQLDMDLVKNKLINAKYPTRALAENLADIAAALAANKRGEEALLQLVTMHGFEIVQKNMEALLDYSQKIMNEKLKLFKNGKLYAEEFLDDATKLKVSISVSNTGSCVFDFTGTSSVHSGNLNANTAIVSSVVVYVLRLLVDKKIPLNEGLMENIKLVIPENSILNPTFDDNPSLVAM
jgi:5-oxoprolinase (ATP-hydrolysing)